MPEELIDIDDLRRKVDDNLARMSRRVKIIDDAVKTGRVVSGDELDALNDSLPTTTADLEIMALMLEAKASSRSRTERSQTNPNDRYEPFVIGTKQQLIKIRQIISEKQHREEPFRFDFIYDEGGGHATPIEVISDGVETNVFNFDSTEFGINKAYFGNESNFYIRRNGLRSYIQTGNQECGVFAIQNLNTLNNMSLSEKKSVGNSFDELDPRFFKMAQSLSSLPESRRNKIITKPTKQEKNLGTHLEQGTIKTIDAKTGKEKLQHRFFDKKYYKYLLEVKNNILDKKSDEEIAAIIARRSNYSEEFNTYAPPVYQPLNERSREEAINDITRHSNGFEVGDVIRSFPPEDRRNLGIDDLLNSKISDIANNDFNNRGEQIKHIIRVFPKDVRTRFADVAISSAEKLPIDDAMRIIEAFPVEERGFFIPTVQSFIERENNAEKVNDIINLFSFDSETALMQPLLKKRIYIETNSDSVTSHIYKLIELSPENQRHHFIDNIKLYINKADSLDKKASQLALLTEQLPLDARVAFHDDVKNLVRSGVSTDALDSLKSVFKKFDFAKLEADMKMEALSRRSSKFDAPPLPHLPQNNKSFKPPSLRGFTR